jgi:hypothetical protein
MRDFQHKGDEAIKNSPAGEPILLMGRKGPRYFLVPAREEEIDFQYEELLRIQALTNLRAWQLKARELGLDQMTDEDIEQEIKATRKERHKKRSHK